MSEWHEAIHRATALWGPMVQALPIIIAVVAALISLTSLLVAWRSFSLARRAFLQSQASCSVHLVDGFRLKANGGAGRASLIAVLEVVNQATIANSVTTIECEVHGDDGIVFVVPHNANSQTAAGASIRNLLAVPMNLAGRASAAGSCCFDLPGQLSRGHIQSIRISMRLADGSSCDTQARLIMDVEDDGLEARRKTGLPI